MKLKKIKIFISILIILLLALVTLVVANSNVQQIIKNRLPGNATTQTADNEIEVQETYSVYMILNELDNETETAIGGNEIKITNESEDLSLSYFDLSTNNEIEVSEEGNVEVPESGLKLKVDGITKGNAYDIEIENVVVNESYISTFNKAVISIDAQNDNEIARLCEIYYKN